jgi:propanol-preferring alcohol dehydrogenase
MATPQTQTAAVIASTAPVSAKVEIRSNYPVPIPGNGEILVKLEFSGVCHSDLHSIRGDTPMLTDVAGHEGVGKVIGGKIRVEVSFNGWNQMLITILVVFSRSRG